MMELLNWEELLKSTMVLFAVVDIVGSIPILVDVKQKAGDIHAGRATLVALGIILIVVSRMCTSTALPVLK